jgi:hypothetical protein
MRISCWITKATNTLSQNVILVAFPLKQLLHERASILRYTYIAYRVWDGYEYCKIKDPMCMWIYKIVLPLGVRLVNWFIHLFIEGLINPSIHGWVYGRLIRTAIRDCQNVE